jgi:hypothetical protein
MDGPWFIYDHYLTVQEWKPNFNPVSDTIKEVAVWMRISGLPIEYYDSQILRFIGNIVGKTVKVDKNTLTQERGKYARLCVQVNLTKPLLAMFTLKGRKYTIEYEGLHMLCMTCGRFGHYKEGCQVKKNEGIPSDSGKGNEGQSSGARVDDKGTDGPWRIVQKQRRSRKIPTGKNISPVGINGVPNISPGGVNAGLVKSTDSRNNGGSRFDVLNDDSMETNMANLEIPEIEKEPIKEGVDIIDEGVMMNMGSRKKSKNRRGNGGETFTKGDNSAERIPKESKLAARGGNSFKGKTGVFIKKGVQHVMEKIGVEVIGNLVGHSNQPNQPIAKSGDGKQTMGEKNVGLTHENMQGPTFVVNPNRPRPPDNITIPPTSEVFNSDENLNTEGEVFEDANDQGSYASSDSEMEVVVETPTAEQ